MYKNFLKRIIDVIISLILLVSLSPLILLTVVFLLVFNSGSVVFRQPRPGLNQNIFTLFKFKTMNDEVDEKGLLLPDDQRLTKIGKWVRKFSLDELPQLINVLRGDMSLVGPRPWLVEYLPLYNSFQKRRHEVRPGITGWAQVNGRNLINWEKRFEYDIFYVDHVSFCLDLKIVCMTIWNILTSKGISAKGTATMQKFTGNE